MTDKMKAATAALVADDESRQWMDGFNVLFGRFLGGNEAITWEKITPPLPGMIVAHSELPVPSDAEISALLSKLVVIKLNGGLGTSMGCTGPKSLVEIRDGFTFLDLVVQQIEMLNTRFHSKVPLVLMNSFNTHKDTLELLSTKYKHLTTPILTFQQSKHPRIDAETMLPIATGPDDSADAWTPPGHGDLYGAFKQSGLMQQMIDQGRDVLFASNIDNMGATVDLTILSHMVNDHREMVMEVTDKTLADIKGGTLVGYEGRVKLLELAQVAPEHVPEFQSITKFKIFNTNSMWYHLPAVHSLLQTTGIEMEIIVNHKVARERPVIQLEQAAGSAIQNFSRAQGVNVPRSRFLPVKATSDLFLLQSDLYTLCDGVLVQNPLVKKLPIVKLGAEFKHVSDFLKRIPHPPSIIGLTSLTVTGDVYFGKNVVLKGDVVIATDKRLDIADGSVFE